MIRLLTKSWNNQWSGVALPLVKSAFAPMLASELVSVQPIKNAPVGLVFYLDFKYGFRVFLMDQELWLEDAGIEGELWCPDIHQDEFISAVEFQAMRDQMLVIPAWEVERDYGLYNENEGRLWKTDTVYSKRITFEINI